MYSAILFWPTEFLVKGQPLIIWGFPCMLLVAFPLLIVIFFLCVSSLLVWLVCDSVCFSTMLILYRTICASWSWLTISFPMLGKFSTIISSNFFSDPFSHLCFSKDAYNSNDSAFNIFLDVSETILNSFQSFPLILLFRSYLHHSPFQLIYPFFCLTYFCYWFLISSVQFSCSVVSFPLWPHGLQHARLPCPSPAPGLYSNSCPLSQWCHPAISSSGIPFSTCLQSFPASGSFPVSQLFALSGQNIGFSASASVLPMNIQDWFPLGWTGCISLQSKGLSRVFSNTTGQKHQFFGAQLSL